MASSATVDWIRERAELLAQEPLPAAPVIWRDTTNYMSIERGHVVALGERFYLVRANEHEGRFGIDDQPKFWVKRALALDSGQAYILKLTCLERFHAHLPGHELTCYRSGEKEAAVIDLVRGDHRFMQGHTERDERGNLVRIIEFIAGTDLLRHLRSVRGSHEEYFHAMLPGILARVAGSFAAIARLHDAGFCHGDIRNDHILIDRETGAYRWIDFDLNEDSPELDIWCAGNILHCVVAKGFVTFHDALQIRPELSGRFSEQDASVLFPNRLMNLRELYGYIPEKLNHLLLRFSSGARVAYDRMSQVAGDTADCAASLK